ncbi:MAG: histone deacetylase family protein, partial [Alphaproteobacteria bacterium]
PGTGHESECGDFDNVVNVELPPGSGSGPFRAAYKDRILPRLGDFCPQLLLISAGFDGHADDPLAMLELTEADFAWVTEQLLDVAATCCDGRVVSVLEGGYDLRALAASTAAHVRALLAVAPGGGGA